MSEYSMGVLPSFGRIEIGNNTVLRPVVRYYSLAIDLVSKMPSRDGLTNTTAVVIIENDSHYHKGESMSPFQGLRITRQRQIILEELRKVSSHPTADEVFLMVRKRLPKISLGTVYRTLEILVENGVIQCLEMGGSQRHYDGNSMWHCHVRCTICNKVADLPMAKELPIMEYAPADSEYEITGYKLEFVGICPACKIEQATLVQLQNNEGRPVDGT